MKGLKEHPDTLLTSGLAEDISTIIDWQKEQDRLAEEREEELEDDIY